MGFGFRVFIFDNNNIKQISLAKYNRLIHGYKNESIPEYAGKRIRTAVVIVETENRKPMNILNIDCEYVNVDKDGKFDQSEREEKMIDAMRMMDIPTDNDSPKNVIDSSSHFAQKRFRNKYLWTPTDHEIQMIKEQIFKK